MSLACAECQALRSEYLGRERAYRQSVNAYRDVLMSSDNPSFAQAARQRMNEARELADNCETLYRDHRKSDHPAKER